MKIRKRKDDLPLLINPSSPAAFRSLLIAKSIQEIELNEEYGFTFDNLDCISKLEFEKLTVLSTILKDDSAVMSIKCKELCLLTKCRNPINYSKIVGLSNLTVWRWRFDQSIFDIPGLVSLGMDAPQTIQGIGQVSTSLQELGIYEGTKALILEEVSLLGNLRWLQLGYCKSLRSVEWVSDLSCLEHFEITGAKTPFTLPDGPWLKTLRTLYLNECGPIESLLPLAQAGQLRTLWFWGTTNIQDGKVRFLQDQGVKILGFRDRKHYDLCQRDLP